MVNKLKDYYNDALNGDIVLTKFLNLEEISEVLALNKGELAVYLDGGHDNSERVRAIIQLAEYSLPSKDDFKIAIYKAKFNKTFSMISHRNMLGSIMSLGIERNTFGDIEIIDDTIYLFISNEIEKFLISNMPLVLNQRLNFEKVFDVPKDNASESSKTIQVPSMRIDAIISHAINVSRGVSLEMISKGLVFVNHSECKNNSYQCKISDIISIRKYGRIEILSNSRTTKKNKLVLEISIKH